MKARWGWSYFFLFYSFFSFLYCYYYSTFLSTGTLVHFENWAGSGCWVCHMMSLKGCVFTYCTLQINKKKWRFIKVDMLFLFDAGCWGMRAVDSNTGNALRSCLSHAVHFCFQRLRCICQPDKIHISIKLLVLSSQHLRPLLAFQGCVYIKTLAILPVTIFKCCF